MFCEAIAWSFWCARYLYCRHLRRCGWSAQLLLFVTHAAGQNLQEGILFASAVVGVTFEYFTEDCGRSAAGTAVACVSWTFVIVTSVPGQEELKPFLLGDWINAVWVELHQLAVEHAHVRIEANLHRPHVHGVYAVLPKWRKDVAAAGVFHAVTLNAFDTAAPVGIFVSDFIVVDECEASPANQADCE